MRCVPSVALAKEGYVGIEIEQGCGFGQIGSVPSASSVLIRNHLFTNDVYRKLRLLQFDGPLV